MEQDAATLILLLKGVRTIASQERRTCRLDVVLLSIRLMEQDAATLT
jgi:hypothetical protein